MVEPQRQQQSSSEQQLKQCLPVHLIVLFDSLSNVDFVNLTKRTLKEKVEALKVAVAKEFARRDGKPIEVKQQPSDNFGKRSQDTQVTSSSNRGLDSRASSSSQEKSRPGNESNHRSRDENRSRDGRQRDEHGHVSRVAASSSSSNRSNRPEVSVPFENTKSDKSSKRTSESHKKASAGVRPPNFADLIKLASTGGGDSVRESNGSRSSPPEPEASPSHPHPTSRPRQEIRHETSNHNSLGRSRQDVVGTCDRNRSSSRPDDRNRRYPEESTGGNERLKNRNDIDNNHRRSRNDVSRERLQEPPARRENKTASETHASVSFNRPNGLNTTRPVANPARITQRNNSGDSTGSSSKSLEHRRVDSWTSQRVLPSNRRTDCDTEVVSKNDKQEKKIGARVRKKDEEERQLELRKQRLRQEEERIKLRNEALAGRKSAQAELKTIVSKTQGSTVLSCGKPPPPPPPRRPPPDSPSSSNGRLPSRGGRDYNDFDGGRRMREVMGPPRGRGIRDPYSRHGTRRDMYSNDYDDAESYDSSMEGFIDDDDTNEFLDDGDVSHHIREIFGYDKRKYADMDDDDIEEASFATIEKEERRSARIGRKEDLEDIRMEMEKKKEKRKRCVIDDDDEDDR